MTDATLTSAFPQRTENPDRVYAAGRSGVARRLTLLAGEPINRSAGRWLLGLFVGLVFIAPLGCGGRGRAEEGADDRSEQAADTGQQPRVRTIAVTAEDLNRSIELPGTVEGYETADLYAKVGGYLEELTVDIGDEVARGDVIARLSIPEMAKQLRQREAGVAAARAEADQTEAAIEQARAHVHSAEAAVAEARAMVQERESEVAFRQAEYNRIKSLADRGSINQEMVEEVMYRLESARGGLNAEKARIDAKRAKLAARETDVSKAVADHQTAQARVELAIADLEYSEEMAKYGVIRSPADGVVIKRMVDPGAFIQPADGNSGARPLVTVARVDRVRVSFQLPMAEVRWLDRGDRAVLDRINVLPGERFEGEVTRFTTALNMESRMMRVEVDLDNAEGRLRPGYYGYVKVFLEEMPQTPVVPASAFMSDEGGSFVYVVEDGVCRRRAVTNIYQDGAIVGIGSGLEPGDRIVQTGGGTLADGQSVVAVPSEPKAG